MGFRILGALQGLRGFSRIVRGHKDLRDSTGVTGFQKVTVRDKIGLRVKVYDLGFRVLGFGEYQTLGVRSKRFHRHNIKETKSTTARNIMTIPTAITEATLIPARALRTVD